jgi:hypothetical protein
MKLLRYVIASFGADPDNIIDVIYLCPELNKDDSFVNYFKKYGTMKILETPVADQTIYEIIMELTDNEYALAQLVLPIHNYIFLKKVV